LRFLLLDFQVNKWPLKHFAFLTFPDFVILNLFAALLFVFRFLAIIISPVYYSCVAPPLFSRAKGEAELFG